MSDFAKRLRQTIAHRGIKAVGLTKAIGVGSAAISRYLSGKYKPSRDRLFVITQYLDVSLDWPRSGSEAPELIKGRKGHRQR